MPGLLRDIQSLLEQQNGGRYFAILLRELARHEPKSFLAILRLIEQQAQSERARRSFCNVRQQFTASTKDASLAIDKEFCFQPEKGNRSPRADLAFMDASDKPVALFEIKDLDSYPKGLQQLKRYLRQTKRGVPFIAISRFNPKPEEQKALDRAKTENCPVALLRFRDIHAALRNSSGQLARLLREYLEDVNVGIYREVECDDRLAILLQQMLAFPDRHGMKTKHSDDAVSFASEAIRGLYGNIEHLGEWIRHYNKDLIRHRMTRKFYILPEFDLKKLRKDLAHDVDTLPNAIRTYVKAGTVLFEAYGAIQVGGQNPPWIAVAVGYGLEIETHKKGVRTYLYTCFYNKNLFEVEGENQTVCDTGYLKGKIPPEKHAEKYAKQCLRESLRKARKRVEGPVRTALDSFNVPD